MLKSLSSTNPFILILIVMLGLMSGYFYYNQTSSDQTYELVLPAIAQDKEFLKFKDLKFDLSLFQNEEFSRLRTFGEFPIEPGVTGKRNIFSP